MRYLISTFLLFPSIFIIGQDADFSGIVGEIKNNLLEVKTSKATFTHELAILNTSVLKYTQVEVDNKGERSELVYEFNVADLDPYLVREETKGDIIYLNMTADNGQKFIKEYEDGAVSGYTSSFSMVTQNIDNARLLKDLIKKAIPFAEEIVSKKLSLTSYADMENWLENNTNNAESGSKTYNQNLVALENFPASFRLIQTEISSKSSTEYQYVFNITDININSMNFNISGSSFSLRFETNRKQKVIQAFEGGVPDGFTDKLEIYANNVEEARNLKNVLQMIRPLADEKVKASITSFDQFGAALSYLKEYAKNINYGDESLEQTIDGNCILSYNTVETTSKSTTQTQYNFNLIDINGNLLDYDVSSNKMYVVLGTKESLDLVKIFENDEFDGYDDEIKIYAENIEIARRIKGVLESLIKVCERDYVDPFEGMTIEQKINWLVENSGPVQIDDETITQTFERNDPSDPNKLKLTKIVVTSKGGSEEIMEFNFTDLNPKSIQYKIGSKSLEVTFETKFSEDIIKYYKDGEIGKYQDDFALTFTDIEKARNIISVFNQIIAELNE